MGWLYHPTIIALVAWANGETRAEFARSLRRLPRRVRRGAMVALLGEITPLVA